MDHPILLVEDNSDDEALTLRALNDFLPFLTIVVARDGVEALDFLFGTGCFAGCNQSISPLVVLLDLRLPKLNGFEVLRSIRENASTKMLPVIVFSSSSNDQDVLDCYTYGANSFIRKPMDYSQYCDNLKQAMIYWLTFTRLPPKQLNTSL
jgi:two-component system, response regulator